MFGQYKRIRNEFVGILTGKGKEYGGSLIRTEATGYGVVYFVENMLNTKGLSVFKHSAVISGSGNVAQFAAEKVLELGGKVLTMSDSKGFIHAPNGLSREQLDFVMELKNARRGRIVEAADAFDDIEFFEGEKPWRINSDIVLPCATQNELGETDAKLIVENKVIAVSEGANMPCTPGAMNVFVDNKVLYSPGKASNAGGVAVSGLEMSQNSLRFNWSREEVDEKLKNIMKSIHEDCVKHGKDKETGYVDYVKGANVAGFIKVAEAMLAQGLV